MSSQVYPAQMTTEQIKSLESTKSLSRIVYDQFKEHKLAVAGSFVILFFLFVAVFAPVIEKVVGIDPNEQNVFHRYSPPFKSTVDGNDVKESKIERFINSKKESALELQNELLSKSLIVTSRPEDALYELILKSEAEISTILSQVDSKAKNDIHSIVKSFETFHLFGTDELGRDVFIRLIYGTRISILVGILAAVASALVGLLIGALAGFYGGIIDSVLMRITDALQSLPLMPVLVVVAAIDLHKIPALKALINAQSESIVKLVLILCLFSWMTVARLVRGAILSLREREFILAARTLGARDRTIILQHIFPNVLAPMLVSVTLGVGESILFEAALSFLGLGIQPPTPSWGNMLFNAQELIYQSPMLAIIPGLLILLTVISFNFIGDGLQDAIDPKSIRR